MDADDEARDEERTEQAPTPAEIEAVYLTAIEHAKHGGDEGSIARTQAAYRVWKYVENPPIYLEVLAELAASLHALGLPRESFYTELAHCVILIQDAGAWPWPIPPVADAEDAPDPD